jgi:two-component system response regulator DesR
MNVERADAQDYAKAGVGGKDELINVVLGRFDAVIARGLEAILGDDSRVRVLATDLNLVAIQEALARRVPDVAILDANAGRTLAQRLKASRTAILVLAHDPPPAYGMVLLMAGYSCAPFSLSASELVDIVHRVAQGERIFASADGDRVRRRYPSDAPPLTERERQVVACLSEGKSYSAIAYELKIGVRTVETHATHARHKLGLGSKRDSSVCRFPGTGTKSTTPVNDGSEDSGVVLRLLQRWGDQRCDAEPAPSAAKAVAR